MDMLMAAALAAAVLFGAALVTPAPSDVRNAEVARHVVDTAGVTSAPHPAVGVRR